MLLRVGGKAMGPGVGYVRNMDVIRSGMCRINECYLEWEAREWGWVLYM